MDAGFEVVELFDGGGVWFAWAAEDPDGCDGEGVEADNKEWEVGGEICEGAGDET